MSSSSRAGWNGSMGWALTTLGFVELSVGRPEAAAERLAPVVAGLVADGLPEPAAAGALMTGDTAEALVEVGRLEEAEAIVELLEIRGAALDRTWAIAVGARCRGLLLAARGDVTGAEQALERALAVHERLPMPIEKARSLLVLGRIRRRFRKRLTAKAALEEALAIFDAVGSSRSAEQASIEIAVPRPSPARLRRPDALRGARRALRRLRSDQPRGGGVPDRQPEDRRGATRARLPQAGHPLARRAGCPHVRSGRLSAAAQLASGSASYQARNGASKPPGMKMLKADAGASPRFSKSWVTPAGMRRKVPAGASTQDSPTRNHSVPAVTRKTSSLASWWCGPGPGFARLHRPLGRAVAIVRLGPVGLEHAAHRAQVVGAAAAGRQDDRLRRHGPVLPARASRGLDER